MDWFKAMLVTVAPRIVAAGAAVVVAKAAAHGVTLDPTETTGLILAAYAGIHKAINSQVNPGDAAKGRIAEAEKVASENGSTVKVAPAK